MGQGCGSVAEHLPTMCRAVGSVPSAIKKQQVIVKILCWEYDLYLVLRPCWKQSHWIYELNMLSVLVGWFLMRSALNVMAFAYTNMVFFAVFNCED